MFDWVGDALGWMGSAISTAWTGAVDTVNDITDAVFDAMFEWTYGLIYGGIAEIFRMINDSATDIFYLPWVQAFLSLFYHLAWMRYTLMQKDYKVMELTISDDCTQIIGIGTIYDDRRIPVGMSMPFQKAMNHWWHRRAIPASRSGLSQALRTLHLSS